MEASQSVLTPGVSIYAVGVGTRPSEHVTLGALRVLRSCTAIFSFNEVQGLEELVGPDARITDMTACAGFGDSRNFIYARVTDVIVEAARRGGPVAWVTTGNPGLLCGVSTELEERASRESLGFARVLGPSSIDALMTAHPKVNRRGLQVIGANALLLHRVQPSPWMNLLVMQVARAETALSTLAVHPKPESLARLQRILIDCYGGDHPCSFLTAERAGGDAQAFDLCLADLCARVEEVNPWTTLFVPAKPAPVDQEIMRSLHDYGSLERFYETPLDALLKKMANDGVAL